MELDMAHNRIVDDNIDTWSSCKMSASESGDEGGRRSALPDPYAAHSVAGVLDNADASKISLSNGVNNNNNNNNKIHESLPWTPTMSLLDLAFKLKQAESRVFGLHHGLNIRPEFPVSEDETDGSGLVERRFVSSDENSKISQFDVLKSSVNPSGSIQKGNVLPLFVDVKAEQLSDSNMEDCAFPLSKAAETSSPYENLNYEALQKRFQCAWCKYGTDSKSHLLRHQKSMHHTVLPRDTTSPVSLTKSLGTSEAGKSSGGRFLRRHRCELCSYQTDSKSHLRRHQGSVHSKKKPYKCHLCKMEFSRSEKAKGHFMNMHSDVPYDSRKMRKFPPSSKETGKQVVDTFTKIKQLYKELDPSNGENPTKGKSEKAKGACTDDDGDDEFSLMEMLEKSKAAKSGNPGNKPYTCLKCDYASRDIWHLKRHISDVHLMRKDYKCKICTYATNRQHRFICHMRTHGEIFCFYCDYSNIKLDVFKQHLQLCSALHKMSTEVQCRLCETDCKDHDLLKEHMTTFHGAVLYSCSKCPYYSEIFEDFESHSQIHEEEERTCNLCNIVFETKQDLSAHCNAVHVAAGEGRAVVCLLCQHQETDRTSMQEHIHRHTPQVYFCDVNDCTFKATTSKSLVLHARYYHDKNQMDLAGMKEQQQNQQLQPSSSTAKLTKDSPVLKSMALGTYTCPICSERPPFRYRKSFEKHMTQHAVEAESCPLCQDTFFLHKELQEHALSVHSVKVV